MKNNKLSPFEQKLNDWVNIHLQGIPFVLKMFFIEHLKIMTKAGLSLVESLDVLSREISNKKFKIVILQVKEDVEKGNQLSEALSKHEKIFPQMYVKMIEAGEIAGRLEESLEQVEIQMKRSHELSSSIKGAMIYPIVILTAMVGVGVFMLVFVFPNLLQVFKEFDTELPLATRILISITDFLVNPINISIILGLFVLLIFIFVISLKKSPAFKRLVHKINLKLPIAGKIIKEINLARFSLTLSSLLKSTIPIVQATEISSQICTNILYKEALFEATQKIKTGIPLSEILSNYIKLFPPMVTEMIMVGERAGEVEKLLEELANFYGDQVNRTMKNFSTIIEPVIIVFLGLAVGGMAIAVIMPMYSLAQNF